MSGAGVNPFTTVTLNDGVDKGNRRDALEGGLTDAQTHRERPQRWKPPGSLEDQSPPAGGIKQQQTTLGRWMRALTTANAKKVASWKAIWDIVSFSGGRGNLRYCVELLQFLE